MISNSLNKKSKSLPDFAPSVLSHFWEQKHALCLPGLLGIFPFQRSVDPVSSSAGLGEKRLTVPD